MKWVLAIILMAQMAGAASFTSISDGSDLQRVNVINELRSSYNERYLAYWNSTNGYITEAEVGTDIQDHGFWSEMQSGLESLCVKYIDHTTTNASIYSGTNGPVTFTLQTWRAAAGLHSNGFSKAIGSWPDDWTDPDDPAFSQGACAAGDYLGPWLWSELQDGISALKWTQDNASPQGRIFGSSEMQEGEEVERTNTNTCQDAIDDVVADWDAFNGFPLVAGVNPGCVDEKTFYSTSAELVATWELIGGSSPPEYNFLSATAVGEAFGMMYLHAPTGATEEISATIQGFGQSDSDVMFAESVLCDDFVFRITAQWQNTDQYTNALGLAGFATDGGWDPIGTVNVGTNDNPYIAYTSDPFTTTGLSCPEDGDSSTRRWGMSVPTIKLIYQWNFSYSN